MKAIFIGLDGKRVLPVRVYRSSVAFVVICVSIVASVGVAPSYAQQKPLESLSKLASDLAADTGNILDVAAIRESKVFGRVLASDSDVLWSQLLFHEDPIAQTAGLLCLQASRPDRVFVASARAILAAKRPGALQLGLLMSIVGEPAKSPAAIRMLADMLSLGNPEPINLAILLTSLGDQNLIAVFQQLDLKGCTHGTIASFVDAITTNAEAAKTPSIEKKLAEAIQMLRPGLGRVRCIYLFAVDPIPMDFIALLDTVLEDREVDDPVIYVLLLKRGGECVEHLKQKLAVLPPGRQKVIKRYLDRTQTNHPK